MADLTEPERFAELVVEFGANVQEGQDVEILADLGTEEAVRAIVGACYRRGARYFFHKPLPMATLAGAVRSLGIPIAP